jgi:NADPH2:quinone reductase
MRSIAVVDERLEISEVSSPSPADQEVLIAVAAAGVNRADILQRKGHYPAPAGASEILGLEVSGTIEKVGSNVRRWSVGDAVCALLPGGGYAEYCIAHEGSCLPIPEGVSLLEAAALPEAIFTVWANLFEPRRLFPAELLLVQGGSSGIGSMAIQMAKALGSNVIATAGSAEKCEFCRKLGAREAFNYQGNWDAQIKQWLDRDQSQLDVVLDMVGGHYFGKHLELLGAGGRLIHIAASKGREVTANIGLIMSKRLLITGSTLRGRPVEEKAQLARGIEEVIWPLIAESRIRPLVHQVFSLEQAAEAHSLIESSRHMGKILIEI